MRPVRTFTFFFLLAAFIGSGFSVSAVENHEIYCARYLQSQGLHEPQGLFQKLLWRQFHRQWLPRKISSQKSFQRAVHKSIKILTRLQQSQGPSEIDGLSRPEKRIYAWAARALLKKEFHDLTEAGGSALQRLFEKMLRQRFLSLLYVVATGILPDKADRPFPQELLIKIEREGILSHFEEIKTAFQSTRQKQVESYRSLQKSAQALYVVIYATVSYAHTHQVIQEQKEEEKENLFQTLQNLDQGLDRLDEIIDQKLHRASH